MTDILTYEQYIDNLRHQTHDKMRVVCLKCGSNMRCVWSKVLKNGNMVGLWKCVDKPFHLKYKVALRLTIKMLYIEYLHKHGESFKEQNTV